MSGQDGNYEMGIMGDGRWAKLKDGHMRGYKGADYLARWFGVIRAGESLGGAVRCGTLFSCFRQVIVISFWGVREVVW